MQLIGTKRHHLSRAENKSGLCLFYSIMGNIWVQALKPPENTQLWSSLQFDDCSLSNIQTILQLLTHYDLQIMHFNQYLKQQNPCSADLQILFLLQFNATDAHPTFFSQLIRLHDKFVLSVDLFSFNNRCSMKNLQVTMFKFDCRR